MTTTPHTRYRSRDWFDTPELYGWLRRAAFKAEGFGEPAYEGRPIIGTVVVHATPESAAGGPRAAVRTGDMIALDVPNRRLDLLVEPAEVARRLAATSRPAPHYRRGYGWLFAQHILQADKGCDFDFLRAVSLNTQPAAGTRAS